MKVLLLSVLTTVSLLAIDAKVKYDEVSLSIDGKNHTYQKGKHFSVDYNQKICFLKGDGVIMFSDKETGLKKQIDEDTPCTTMSKKIVKQNDIGIFATILRLPPKTSESVKDGVNRDGNEIKKVSGNVVLKKEIKEVVIEDKNWAPLPITLKLFNEEGEEVKKELNKHNLTTKFTLNAEEIKDGYRIEVKNRSNDMLVNIKFIEEKRSK